MVRDLIKTCEFLEVSDLIPEDWVRLGFWSLVSESAPFSWGDNNRTLVTASDFLQHVISIMDVSEPESRETNLTDANLDEDISFDDYSAFVEMMGELKETYVDLEN